ncbi:MAG: glutathione S-transferase [Robiginitomaculum sp.]
MLKVYHLPKSRSLRVLWLLEELELPYEIENLEFIPGKFGGDKYTRIHPLNKVPAIDDDGMVMFESIAIMQYIMNKYGSGNLRPNVNNVDYGHYLQWLHFGESSLAPVIANLMYQRHFFALEKRSQDIDDWAQLELSKLFSLLETQLSNHEYLFESGFSAADISVGYCLLLARIAKAHDQITDRIEEYWQTLTDRNAWDVISKTI